MTYKSYNPSVIEPKWQKVWEKNKLNVTNIKGAKKPFYNLMMFPYPSAEGLHVGNMYAFTASDVYGRFKRLQGNDVFEPIGLDGFGIHSENYALKVGRHPKEHAAMTQKNFYAQLHKIGCMFDWTRTVETYNPDYYKWTQWVFVQMWKAGLAYRGKAKVNWCPTCKTVLSDEQVIDGKCERTGDVVEKKETEQWFFKITAYADRLLDNLAKIDWTEKIKTTQKNWIGKKEGTRVEFQIKGSDRLVEVFTTRPDTLWGATFIVVSPDSVLLGDLVAPGKKGEINEYVSIWKLLQPEARLEEREKDGIFTGSYAINPINGREIPVWVANYVVGSYGSGVVMGVPAHDQRDFDFAKKYDLPIIEVVSPTGKSQGVLKTSCEEYGILLNSGRYTGMRSEEATERIVTDLGSKAGKAVTYHLRDWLVSRQRYWGAPIPMIYCPKCGWQAVPEEELPVLLPDISDYQPEGNGKGPLAKHPEFYKTKCPKCGGEAQRETDVCDTFLDSSWYFLRYPSVGVPISNQVPFEPEATKKWLPVAMYTGGAEHAVLHLMYSRFVTMVLFDQGEIPFEEPFTRFFAHGLLIKDGAKMSKSRGNVVNPDEYIAKYGTDALRLYLMFMGPVDLGGDFRDSGMEGMRRWVERVYRIINDQLTINNKASDKQADREMAKLVSKATEGLEARRYNVVIAGMMEFLNFVVAEKKRLTKAQIEAFLMIFSVFAPHLAEELYQGLGLRNQSKSKNRTFRSVHEQKWPEMSTEIAAEAVTIAVSVNGKTRATLEFSGQEAKALDQKRVEQMAKSDNRVEKYLSGKMVKRVVYVPGKVINFIV